MPIVRRGAPIGRNVGPLQGMSFPTVEGRLNLGYLRGGRNGIGLLLPVDPTVPIPSTVQRKATVHGIGAFTRGRGLGAATISGPNGPATSFRVGDAYTVSITGGTPNSGVYFSGSQCSPDFSRCAEMPRSGQQDIALSNWMGSYQTGNSPVGKYDANGNWSMSGVFTPAQVGLWTMPFGQFTVSDASGSAAYTGPITPGGTPYYTLASNHPASATYTPAQLLAMAGGAAAPPPVKPPVVPPSPPGGSSSGSDTSGNGGGSASGFDLSSIPTWGWIAAAGVGALLIFRGHHQ